VLAPDVNFFLNSHTGVLASRYDYGSLFFSWNYELPIKQQNLFCDLFCGSSRLRESMGQSDTKG